MIKFFLKTLIRFYQILISPLLGPSCRYEVSCSNNMLLCLNRFGVILGVYFGLKQIVSCNPWFAVKEAK